RRAAAETAGGLELSRREVKRPPSHSCSSSGMELAGAPATKKNHGAMDNPRPEKSDGKDIAPLAITPRKNDACSTATDRRVQDARHAPFSRSQGPALS